MNIQEGDPSKTGLYVAYINGPVRGYTDRRLLLWFDNRWCFPASDQLYRDHVYGWIGPIPSLGLTE